jgi:hypothetical protein
MAVKYNILQISVNLPLMVAIRYRFNYCSYVEKTKANLSLCLSTRHATKAYGEWRYGAEHRKPRHQMEVSGEGHAQLLYLQD